MAHKPRRDRRRTQIAGSDGAIAVGAEPSESDVPIAIDMETAAIGKVTSAMMDEAAHKAVEAVSAERHQAAVHSASVSAEDLDEPVPQPTHEATIVEPIPSEDQAASEHEPSAFPDIASSPIGIAAQTLPPPDDAGEMAPAMVLPSLEAIEPMASAEEAAAPMIAESLPAKEALVALHGDMMPPRGMSTSPTEAFERTGEPLRRNLALPGDAIGLLNSQVIEMLAMNMAATGQFLSALMGATSMTEVMAVNTHHLRRQMELMTTQGRQLTTLARTIALDAMRPFGPSSTDHIRDR